MHSNFVGPITSMQNTTIGAEISDILLDVFKNRSCSEIDSRLALLLEMEQMFGNRFSYHRRGGWP